MKYLSFFISLIFLLSCKNTPEKSPKDFAIQNTSTGKVLLRFQPKLNEQIEMMTNVIIEPISNRNQNIDFSLHYKMRTAAIEDSLYTYAVDMQKVVVKSKIDGIQLKYDSSRENTGLAKSLDEQIKPILASQFTLQITNKAEIRNIEWKNKKIDFPINQESFSSITVPLPDEPVGVNDQWEKEIDIMEFKAKIAFSVEEITANEVKIKLYGKEKEKNLTEFDGYYILDRKTSFTKFGEINLYSKEEAKQVKIIFKAL